MLPSPWTVALAICTIFSLLVCVTKSSASDNATDMSSYTRRITEILDGLLQNYQAHIRPNVEGNRAMIDVRRGRLRVEGPTKINFDIVINSFGPIQDIDMVREQRSENRSSLSHVL